MRERCIVRARDDDVVRSSGITGIDGGITSRRYTEEMLTEVFIIYLMNAIQQVVMTSCPKIIT